MDRLLKEESTDEDFEQTYEFEEKLWDKIDDNLELYYHARKPEITPITKQNVVRDANADYFSGSDVTYRSKNLRIRWLNPTLVKVYGSASL